MIKFVNGQNGRKWRNLPTVPETSVPALAKSVRLETREARRKLAPAHEPHWRSVGRGVAVGYRKSAEGAAWYVRRYARGAYHKRVLGDTDDQYPADGQFRLSWSDALRLALDKPKRDIQRKLHYTVREAFEGYFRHREARGRSEESLAFDRGKTKPFPEKFGDTYLADLATGELQAWRDALIVAAGGESKLNEAEKREAKRRAQATVNRSWAVIRAGLNWAFTTGQVDSDLAWRRVKPFRTWTSPARGFCRFRRPSRSIPRGQRFPPAGLRRTPDGAPPRRTCPAHGRRRGQDLDRGGGR